MVVDPPWPLKQSGRKRVRPNSSGGTLPYRTMTMDGIADDIGLLLTRLAPGGNLFLWAVEKYLYDAETIMRNYVMHLHMRWIWAKHQGMSPSYDVRYAHEYLLWYTKGKLRKVASDYRGTYESVFEAKPRRHSQKPDLPYQHIVNLYPDDTRLDAYARQPRDGWDVMGDEL
jgi:N6-adenosine-specific RNA methylase IME4